MSTRESPFGAEWFTCSCRAPDLPMHKAACRGRAAWEAAQAKTAKLPVEFVLVELRHRIERLEEGSRYSVLGVMADMEFHGEWRKREGGGVVYSFCETLLKEAGGFARLLAEWERVTP